MRIAIIASGLCFGLIFTAAAQAGAIQKRVENGVTVYYGVPSAPPPARPAPPAPSYRIVIDSDYLGADLGQNMRILRDDQMAPVRRGARRHSCDCGAWE